MKLYSPAVISSLMEKHSFKPSKSMGQNFLADGNITEKIIDAAGIEKKDVVIEVGPGMGVMTAAAASRAAKVIAIEKDRALIPVLKDALCEYDNIEIINDDILKTDINSLTGRDGIKIIGNLPYYITTPIIMKVLEEKVKAESLTVMVQREVADRLKAVPGTKDYGAITASVNYYCEVCHIADVPRSVFIPKPNVDSAVIRLDIRKGPPVNLIDESVFFAVIKAGFGQRRKTLLNALTGLYGLDRKEIEKALENATIAPGRRAETLDIYEFAEIAAFIHKGKK